MDMGHTSLTKGKRMIGPTPSTTEMPMTGKPTTTRKTGARCSDVAEEDPEDSDREESNVAEWHGDIDQEWEELAKTVEMQTGGRVTAEECFERRSKVNRQEQIVTWLSKSSLVKRHGKGEGFFISRGERVKLNDGTEKEVLGWLFEEGIVDGSYICGYSVAHTAPGGPYHEKLSFFKVDKAIDAPF